jgi:thiosulfate dehydrogenase [quinone] large subunit
VSVDRADVNGASSDQRIAYVLLRLALGVDFLGHGSIRLLHGNAAFAQWMVKHMAEAPLPSAFVYGFGWLLPFLEAALGLLLIAGLLTRWALIAGSLLMISLLVGVALMQDWAMAGLQLSYCLIFSILLFLRARDDATWPALLRGV